MRDGLPPDLTSIFDSLWAVQLKARREAIAERVAAEKAAFTNSWQLQPAATQDKFKRMFREELRGRCSRLLDVLKRVLEESLFRPSPSAAAGIEHELIQVAEAQTLELSAVLANELSSLSLGGGDLAVQDEYITEKQRLHAEIALLFKTRLHGSSHPVDGQHPTATALSTEIPGVRASWSGRLNSWLENEAKRRGRFWLVVGAVLALLFAALALF